MLILDLILPLYCAGCGRTGQALCKQCTATLLAAVEGCCVTCGNYCLGWRCPECGADDTFAFGFFDQAVGQLAANFKLQSARHLARPLAQLLAAALPTLAGKIAVAPVPTSRAHQRERGLAHAELLARELARAKGWYYLPALTRLDGQAQRGQSRHARQTQAAGAYRLGPRANALADYDIILLVDDISTTGATLDACTRLLRAASGRPVRRAVLAKTR